MYRSLVLLALPLLLVGCGSSGSSSESSTTIDSFRSSFLSGQQAAASSQVAAMPDRTGGQAQPAFKPLSSDQSGKAPAAFQPNSATQQESEAPYKASIAAYIKRYAVNDNSLNLAKIGTPFQSTVNGQKGSVVCVELGGLSSNRTAYLLRDDAVIDSEIGAQACRGKQLAPWNNTGT